MGDQSSSQAFTSSASPVLTLSSSPFSVSYGSPTDASHSYVFNPPASPAESSALQKFSSNIYTLLSTDFDDSFSDVLIYVSNRVVPLHRCILAAGCPFFKSLFLKDKRYLDSLAPGEPSDEKSTKLKIDLGRLLLSTLPSYTGKVCYDALLTIIGFLYSGHQTVTNVKCIDDHCLHEACGPVVEYAVQMLGLSSVFDLGDLKIFWQHYLQELLEKAQVDEVLPVLVAAKAYGAEFLLSTCKHIVAVSNMGTVDIEKQLSMPLSGEVLAHRCKMGLLQPETLNPTLEKECQRIRKALDSDDVELVRLLLNEGRVSLDSAYALHYAAAYCDPRTVNDILELGLADINARNNRGFSVLHVASMRQDPSILVSLLYKGSNVLETTPDGRTSLQLCSRLMRRFGNDINAGAADLQKENVCLEILSKAGMKNLFEDAAFPPVTDENEFLERLFVLENRAAVCRLLFPQEASVVQGTTHLESTTSEFVGFRVPDILKKLKREASMDLNQLPSTHASINGVPTPSSPPVISEALIKRIEALQKTVTLGRKLFPGIISAIDAFTDDGPPELVSMKLGSLEEHKTMKRRYSELTDMLAEASQKDAEGMELHKTLTHVSSKDDSHHNEKEADGHSPKRFR